MAKSLFTEAHRAIVKVLVDARSNAGLKQAEVASRIGKDQSYISNIERCQRRIDLVELHELARALGADPKLLLARAIDEIEIEIVNADAS